MPTIDGTSYPGAPMPVDFTYVVPQEAELVTSGDVFTSDDLDGTTLEIELDLRPLSTSQKNALVSHYLNTARGSANSFTFVDDEGNSFPGARYWMGSGGMRVMRVPGGWRVRFKVLVVQ